MGCASSKASSPPPASRRVHPRDSGGKEGQGGAAGGTNTNGGESQDPADTVATASVSDVDKGGAGCRNPNVIAAVGTPPSRRGSMAGRRTSRVGLHSRCVSISSSTVFGEALWPEAADSLPQPEQREWKDVLNDLAMPEMTVYMRGSWRGRTLTKAVEGSYTRDQEGEWIVRVRLPREEAPSMPVPSPRRRSAADNAAPTTVVFFFPPLASTEEGGLDVHLRYNDGGQLSDAHGTGTFSRLPGGAGIERGLLSGVDCGEVFSGDLLLYLPQSGGKQRMRCDCTVSVGQHELEPLTVGYAAVGGAWYLSGLSLDGVLTPVGTLIVRNLTLQSVEPGSYRTDVQIDSWPRAVDVSLQHQDDSGRFVTTTYHWVRMTYTVSAVLGEPLRRDIDVTLDVRPSSVRDRGLLLRAKMRGLLYDDDEEFDDEEPAEF